MTAIHGKATGVFLGAYDLTQYLRDITPARTMEPADASHFGTQDKQYVAGMSDATIGYGGLYSGTEDEVATILEAAAAQENAEPVTVLFGGVTVGSPAQVGQARVSAFEVSSPLTDIVSISGSTQCDGGLGSGVCLSTLTPVTATGPGASHDAGAASTRGGRVALHVTANDRDGATTVTVQHSTDNSVWVDLHEFDAVAADATASELALVSGTINRYTRALVTLAGTSGEVVAVVVLNRK